MRSTLGAVSGRARFTALRHPTARARSGPLLGACVITGDAPAVAFAVGRSNGSAVARNLIRRRLRALARQHVTSLPQGDLLIRTSPDVATMSFAELSRHFDRIVRLLNERH